MKIAFYGSSLLSAYWNGAATYYRGMLRNLAALGHEIRFYEPDAFDRQQHRDIEPPDWAQVVVYPADEASARAVITQAGEADAVIKASGVGVFDDLLLEVWREAAPHALRIFWDVDAPATIGELRTNPDHPLRQRLPSLDLVLTYGGGPPIVDAYQALGARRCVPVYNGLDPTTHHPVPPEDRFRADLSFLGNRLPDREARVDQFFFDAAHRLPERQFIIAGSGWESRFMPASTRNVGHVGTVERKSVE